jgi:hypothetical protein
MKRRVVFFLIAVSLSGLLGFLLGVRGAAVNHASFIPATRAQTAPARGTECTAALLQGAFAFDVWGENNNSQPGIPGSAGPYATLGLLTFNGQGGLSLVNTQSYNGFIVPPQVLAGVYFLSADCTGRITLNTGAVFSMVAAAGGRELHLMQINGGSVNRGVAKRI